MSDRLSVLAHELRSPVAALTAIAAAFHDADAAGRRRLLELAAAASGNIERLLGDASPVSLRIERLDASGLVRDASDSAALSGARVKLTVEPGLFVDADPQRLRQALDNLIGNARGHSPPGGAVVVTASADGGRILITVSDSGEGIDPIDQGRIFAPGVRLTDARPGSGLGLAIVRAVAEAHGGTVEVESAPGHGASFTLSLPQASFAPA
jgi:two-component system, OmpR family, sensor histidine kinase BaeS